MRLAALPPDDLGDEAKVRRALLAHLCRCTGWQPILDAVVGQTDTTSVTAVVVSERHQGSGDAADRRASIEGGSPQRVGVDTVLGNGGFADDSPPSDALVALRAADGSWTLGESLADARRAVGKVQGRRTTTEIAWPIALPTGEFDRVLQTTWVEPGYLEPDASWCQPSEQPASPLGNGGAFGAKRSTPVGEVASQLSAEQGRAVRALYSREDVVTHGPKRPPVAIGMNSDGRGVVRIARTQGPLPGAEALAARWPGMEFEFVDVVGPPVSLDLRAAVDAELAVVAASFQTGPEFRIEADNGSVASAVFDGNEIGIRVECGDPLDETVLRSYCTGAAHMALGLVTSEAIRLGADGSPADLTIRSFGIIRAVDTPTMRVEVVPSSTPPVNGSDAVFAAVAAAVWAYHGHAPRWPTGAPAG